MNSLGDCFRVAKTVEHEGAFDIVGQVYWWLSDHNRGQGSWEYKALCSVQRIFNPGACDTGPDGLNDCEVYEALCQAEECPCTKGYVHCPSCGSDAMTSNCRMPCLACAYFGK